MVTVNVRDDGTIEGYITVSEWANKNNISASTARYYISSKRLKSIKIGNTNYVKENEPMPEPISHHFNIDAWVNRVCDEIEKRGERNGY